MNPFLYVMIAMAINGRDGVIERTHYQPGITYVECQARVAQLKEFYRVRGDLLYADCQVQQSSARQQSDQRGT